MATKQKNQKTCLPTAGVASEELSYLFPMKLSLNRSRALAGLILALGLALAKPTKGDGIPEPSLILYGTVTNATDGSRLTVGALNWVIQPGSGGSPITLSGALTNINDQFCYVFRVPCETQIPGVSVSAGALTLASTPTSYNLAQVTIAGVTTTLNQPSLTNLTLSFADRGRIQRIDLTVSLPTNNAWDAWQLKYFGHLGVDPNADPDHDGMTNGEEFLAGTDPTDPQSAFAIIRVDKDASGGVDVQWSSVQGKLYTVLRSGDLLSGFTPIQIHIPGIAPLNLFHDTNAIGAGPYFYRMLVEQ
jgi:hypothetical protein